MNLSTRRLVPFAAVLPMLLVASAGCDVMTADLKHTQTAQWRKTYELAAGGRVEINNVNGKIAVEPSTGNTVEVLAVKTAKAATTEGAKQALERIEIREDVSSGVIRVETKVAQGHGWFGSGGTQVAYTVRVPAAAEVKFTTVNGGVEVTGLTGRVTAETTNGGVVARNVSGAINASTTNGGVDVELAQVADGGARLECTNGGIKLRLPSEAKASISASITNGGIDAAGLAIETSESTRRRLVGRLNGGGPSIRLEGTNGGITIAAR
jgi:Putative adhesin